MRILIGLLIAAVILGVNTSIMLTSGYLELFYKGDNIDYALATLNYVKGSNNFEIDIFTKEEVAHLNDVRLIIKNVIIIRDLSLIIFIAVALYLFFIKKTSDLSKGLCFGGMTLFTLSLAFLLIISVSFQSFFIGFHKMFFPQGNWSFPADSMLITLFPQKFWFSAALHFILLTLIESVLLATSCPIVKLIRYKNKKLRR